MEWLVLVGKEMFGLEIFGLDLNETLFRLSDWQGGRRHGRLPDRR